MPVYTILNGSSNAVTDGRDAWAGYEVRDIYASHRGELPSVVQGGHPFKIIAIDSVPSPTSSGWSTYDEYKAADARTDLASLLDKTDALLRAAEAFKNDGKPATQAEFLHEGASWVVTDLGVGRVPVEREIVVLTVGEAELALRIDHVEHRPGTDPVAVVQSSVERCTLSLLERVKDTPVLQTKTGGQIKQATT